MSYIYVVGFGDTGRVKVGWSGRNPERRVEAHKRGARAYLECTKFEVWISIDHEEGVENEKALIEWCRERTGEATGEYFTLPFAEVLAFAQTLPMTAVPPRTDPRAARDAVHDKWLADLTKHATAYRALCGMLGEDALLTLEFVLNRHYPLPEHSAPIRPHSFSPEQLDQVQVSQQMKGLGMNRLDLAAGRVIAAIELALLERQEQARKKGRDDLLEPGETPRVEQTMTPLEYVLWASWRSIDALDYVGDAMFYDPESAAEVLDSLKTHLIREAEKTLRKVRQSVDRYPDGSPVRVIREDARVYNYKIRLPWETADPDETFGPAEPALEVVR